MMKCQHYLPLCYGVDGVVDFKLYSYEPSNTTDIEYIWYALIDSYNIQNTPPQFEAIKQANAKLAVYGPILKNLKWIDATTISTEGVDSFDNNIYYSGENIDLGVDPYFSQTDIKTSSINNNQDLYEGYVHIGYFKDDENYRTYMLVNRRTDYVTTASNSMKYITPADMMQGYAVQDSIIEASSQFVEFNINQDIAAEFGEYVALFDPASKQSYHKNESAKICVEIDPGEGIMLELASTLPEVITENIILKGKVLIDATNTIVIPQNITIATNDSSSVYINQDIEIPNGAKLILRGDVEINSTITVKEGGELKIENSQSCAFSDGVYLYLDGGKLEVTDSFLTSSGSQWTGIRTAFSKESESIIIENSTIKAYVDILIFGTPIDINNSSFYPINTSLTLGIFSGNNQTNHITNSKFIPMYNSADGITLIDVDNMNMVIDNVEFERLSNAINIYDSDLTHLTVVNSNFEKCTTGINLSPLDGLSITFDNNYFINCKAGINSVIARCSGIISDCSFICNDDAYQCIGIDLSFDGPIITNCSFNYMFVGIKAELMAHPGMRDWGVFDSEFNNCKYAIISRGANMSVRNSTFYRNQYGVVSFEESNMNLSNNANNVLKNCIGNICFLGNYGNVYRSKIQLLSGHNDFYHEIQNGQIAFDYYFSNDYYYHPLERPINGSKNWYSGNNVRIHPPEAHNYVQYNPIDSEPNVSIIPVNPRFYLALTAEQNSNYEDAATIYRAILDEALIVEDTFWNSCIDGIFRCDFLVNKNFNEALSYLEEKKVQYTLIDESFVKLIDTYIMKVKLIKKEYQDVITILENKINNPTSTIDSLSAVLDLEIVLKLADGGSSKSPVNTSLAQYRYKDFEEFQVQHSMHWDMLMSLSNLPETDNFVEMIPDKVDVMNYPNPFNPETTIRFGIPKSGNTEIKIYNIKGQLVKSLFKGYKEAGYHSVVWNGRNRDNQSVASGIYFTRVTCEGKSKVTKLMLMK